MVTRRPAHRLRDRPGRQLRDLLHASGWQRPGAAHRERDPGPGPDLVPGWEPDRLESRRRGRLADAGLPHERGRHRDHAADRYRMGKPRARLVTGRRAPAQQRGVLRTRAGVRDRPYQLRRFGARQPDQPRRQRAGCRLCAHRRGHHLHQRPGWPRVRDLPRRSGRAGSRAAHAPSASPRWTIGSSGCPSGLAAGPWYRAASVEAYRGRQSAGSRAASAKGRP